ncbi:hypothetical protein NDU88_004890 [Pleurodeles waltl]|uniref:Uncharacterized protein n=1 Tax=Pleurodeles waltl TaxID=8319 RepID=A0AAV7M7L9_PLEWA|nr:hypothetical protein NDU88_004890 [Pleurodeles waltl]
MLRCSTWGGGEEGTRDLPEGAGRAMTAPRESPPHSPLLLASPRGSTAQATVDGGPVSCLYLQHDGRGSFVSEA